MAMVHDDSCAADLVRTLQHRPDQRKGREKMTWPDGKNAGMTAPLLEHKLAPPPKMLPFHPEVAYMLA